jgi:hypothetical protein
MNLSDKKDTVGSGIKKNAQTNKISTKYVLMWAAKQVGTRALHFTCSNRSMKYQSRRKLNIALTALFHNIK